MPRWELSEEKRLLPRIKTSIVSTSKSQSVIWESNGLVTQIQPEVRTSKFWSDRGGMMACWGPQGRRTWTLRCEIVYLPVPVINILQLDLTHDTVLNSFDSHHVKPEKSRFFWLDFELRRCGHSNASRLSFQSYNESGMNGSKLINGVRKLWVVCGLCILQVMHMRVRTGQK